MSWISVGVAAVGTTMSVIEKSKAEKQKKKIANEIANQKGNDLNNIADGLQVSTRSADLQREETARQSATSLDALSGAGTRALGVGVGRIAAVNADTNARIGADLDEQQKNIDFFRAQDKGNIRLTKEQRANANLAALSSQYNAASQNGTQATANIIQGLGTAASAYAGRTKIPKVRKEVESVNSITPVGTTPIKSVKSQITAPSLLSDPYYNKYNKG